MLLLCTDGRSSLLLQPRGYWADFQLLAARRCQTSAMLALSRKSIQDTLHAMPGRLAVNIPALVNNVVLVATTLVYVYTAVIYSAICRIAAPKALLSIF